MPCQVDGNESNPKKLKWCRRLTYALTNDHPSLPRASVLAGLRAAFDIWQKHPETDIIFTLAAANARADIEVLWELFPPESSLHGEATLPPENCHSEVGAGRVRLNLRRRWTFEERSGLEEPIDFITLAAHEIGHAIGMGHNPVDRVLMNTLYDGSHRFLADWDLAYYKFIYYEGPEPPT